MLREFFIPTNLSALTATQKNFGYNQSIMILVFVVLGGIGNIRGSRIAAVILTLLPELLRGLNTYRMLIYAIVLILAMLFNSAPQFITLRKRIFGGLKPQHAAIPERRKLKNVRHVKCKGIKHLLRRLKGCQQFCHQH